MNSLNVSPNANAAVIEAAFEAWQQNPDSVDPTWRAFFQGFTLGNSGNSISAVQTAGVRIVDSLKQAQVGRLINAYRAHGHLQAHLDPLGEPPPPHPQLTLAHFGLDESDVDDSFTLTNFKGGGQMKLRDIVAASQQTSSGHIGVEYMHCQDHEAREWLQAQMEGCNNQPSFNQKQQIRILRRLHKAELFEKFLHTKYVGQ